MFRYSLFLMLSLFVLSCSDRPIYSEKHEIEKGNWVYGEPLSFSFEVTDTVQIHDLVLQVEHDREYNAQNVYCKFTTTYPDQHSTDDVVSIELSDNFGKWIGDCSRSSCTIDIMLQSRVRFKDLGTHKITIDQYTRSTSLYGIESMELKLFELFE